MAPIVPSVQLAKACATSVALIAVLANNVRPPMVIELPAAKALNATDDVCCVAVWPFEITTVGEAAFEATARSVSLPDVAAVNVTALPDAVPVDQPDKAKEPEATENVPVTPPFE